jgi:hypothetical protein
LKRSFAVSPPLEPPEPSDGAAVPPEPLSLGAVVVVCVVVVWVGGAVVCVGVVTVGAVWVVGVEVGAVGTETLSSSPPQAPSASPSAAETATAAMGTLLRSMRRTVATRAGFPRDEPG